jgi:Dockerin type I domain
MGVLIGDVDGNGRVDGNDVSAVQSHTRQSVDSTNFRYDVNASGLIDGNDVSMTQGHTRTSLP